MNALQTKLSGLLLAITSLLLSGQAAAGQAQGTFTMSLTVEPHCEMSFAKNNILMNMTGMTASLRAIGGGFSNWMFTGVAQDNSVWVKCNEGLPYQLELDTNIGGTTTLTDASTGVSVPYRLSWGTVGSAGPRWGQIANGEQFYGVGTGIPVNMQFTAQSNWPTNPGYTPPVGTYHRLMSANLVF